MCISLIDFGFKHVQFHRLYIVRVYMEQRAFPFN